MATIATPESTQMRTDHLSQDFIHRQLDASQDAVEAALLAILDRQTAEERAGYYTREANGVGFSKFDAEFCTSLCHQLKMGRKLTPRQLEVARKKVKRYWRQLITVMTTEAPMPVGDNAQEAVKVLPRAEVAQEARIAVGSW